MKKYRFIIKRTTYEMIEVSGLDTRDAELGVHQGKGERQFVGTDKIEVLVGQEIAEGEGA